MDLKYLSDELILIGDDAETFFQSRIGQYVISKSEQEIQNAMIGLTTVDPLDTKQIINLQNRIHNAEQALIWLKDAIMAARQEINNRLSLDGMEH